MHYRNQTCKQTIQYHDKSPKNNICHLTPVVIIPSSHRLKKKPLQWLGPAAKHSAAACAAAFAHQFISKVMYGITKRVFIACWAELEALGQRRSDRTALLKVCEIWLP